MRQFSRVFFGGGVKKNIALFASAARNLSSSAHFANYIHACIILMLPVLSFSPKNYTTPIFAGGVIVALNISKLKNASNYCSADVATMITTFLISKFLIHKHKC